MLLSNTLNLYKWCNHLYKKGNNLLKKFCQAKDPEKRSKLHKQCKLFKNHIMNLSRKSKETHFKIPFEEKKRSSFKIRQGIKEIINLNPQSQNIGNFLKINDSIVTDKNVVVNEFNDFFNSIASKINTKIIKTDSKFYETLKNLNEKNFFLNQTTKE